MGRARAVVRFTDAELAEIRQLFRERVESHERERRARIPRRRSQRPPPLAIRADVALPDDTAILRPGELAALLGVSPSTHGRWASDGYVPSFRTLGGQWRFRWADVRAQIGQPD
jgi:excisionase family DNA binding protein